REPVANGAESKTAPGVVPAAPTADAPLAGLLLVISSTSIQNGSVAVTDVTHSPPQSLQATHIDFSASDISAATPIAFSLAAAVDKDAPNVKLQGSVGPLRQRDAVPFRVAGSVGPLGDRDLQIDDLEIEGVLAPDSVRATTLDGHAFGGTFTFTGQVLRQDAPQFALKGEAADISLAQVAKLQTEQTVQRLDGVVRVTLDLYASGNTQESLLRTLTGRVDTDVEHGSIKGLNIVGEAIDRLSGIPGLTNVLSQNIKPNYKRILDAPDTQF